MFRVFITIIIISIVQPNASKELSNVFNYSPQACFDGSTVSSKFESSYELHPSTKNCSNLLKQYRNVSKGYRLCPTGLASIEISPIFHPAIDAYAQYAKVDITLKIHDKIEAAFIQLECLNAQTGEDKYCSDSPDMYHDNVHMWPCRGMQFNMSKVVFPAVFTYKCFRLFPHSTTAINVTIFPQNCRMHTINTAPQLNSMFPAKWVDEVGNQINDNSSVTWIPPMAWSPMVVVDMSESDGVWIKIAKPDLLQCQHIDILLFEDVNGTTMHIKSLQIRCNNNNILGVKWFDVKKSKYYLTAYVPFGKCSQRCDQGLLNCKICPHTEMEFIVGVDHFSTMWKIGTKISAIPLGLMLAIVVALIFCLAGVVGFICSPSGKPRGPPVPITLHETKRVLLIYAEDTPRHKTTIETFRECLQRNADTWASINDDMLREQSCQPSRWINHVYTNVYRHLIVLSPLATKVIDNSGSEEEGQFEVEQTQPYPDMFKTCFDKVLRECATDIVEARTRIGVVLLPYSGPIPRKLSILGLPTFSLPDDFTKLTAFIHHVDIRNRNVIDNLTTEMRFVFDRRIEATKHDMEERPDWIVTRWVPVQRPDDVAARVPMAAPPREYNTDQERIEASERLNLLPPDLSDDEEKEGNTFQLYGPDDDEDEAEDKKEEDEEKKSNKSEAETGV